MEGTLLLSASWKQSPDGLAPAMGLAPATYLHEEQAHDEGAALAVAHLPVYQGVCLQGNVSVRAGPARPGDSRPMDSASACRARGWRGPHLHDIEEDLLAQAVLALEELMLRVSAGNVPADQLLARRGHLEQLRVLVLDGHVRGTAQELPHDGPEVMRDALVDQLLGAGRGSGRPGWTPSPCSLPAAT